VKRTPRRRSVARDAASSAHWTKGVLEAGRLARQFDTIVSHMLRDVQIAPMDASLQEGYGDGRPSLSGPAGEGPRMKHGLNTVRRSRNQMLFCHRAHRGHRGGGWFKHTGPSFVSFSVTSVAFFCCAAWKPKCAQPAWILNGCSTDEETDSTLSKYSYPYYNRWVFAKASRILTNERSLNR
jgi:hypothetical protein